MDKLKYEKPSKDFSIIKFGDKRLDNRLQKSVEYMTKNSQNSILSSGQTRHDAKAFYALLSNEKFKLKHLITAYQNGTIERIRSSKIQSFLLIQDTTDINLNGHKKTKNLGFSSEHVRGIQTHSCIAVTEDGVPLGLMNQIYHTREKDKSSLTHHEKVKRSIEEKESFRWLKTARDVVSKMPENVTAITVCDREGDFYEFYSDLTTIGSDFVIRLLHDRETIDGERLIQHFKPCENIEISVPRNTRENIPQRTAVCEVSFGNVEILKPKKADINQPRSHNFSVVRIFENSTAKGRIEWLLTTSLSVNNIKDCLRVLNIYIQRWKIERFHFVLKSGCQVERIQQRTYERIQPIILILSVIAIYIMAMTYLSRICPDINCDAFFDDEEWKILYRLIKRTKIPPERSYKLQTAINWLGELGSFKHIKSDGNYGLKSVLNGLIKLYDAIDYQNRLMGQV